MTVSDTPRPAATVQPVDHAASHRKHHLRVLTACTVIVGLALSLRTRADQRVEFAWLSGFPLPETCASRGLFDVECAGCGLTRSFIALADGDFAGAFGFNRTGWLLACGLLIQFPYRLHLLHHLRTRGLPEPGPGWLKPVFAWTLIAALFGNWALKILGI